MKEGSRQERERHINRAQEMILKFVPIAEKYAKLNGIELPDDDKDYDEILQSFLKDAKFIDFPFDECGIRFTEELFKTNTENDE